MILNQDQLLFFLLALVGGDTDSGLTMSILKVNMSPKQLRSSELHISGNYNA